MGKKQTEKKQTRKMPAGKGAGILWSILSGNGIPVDDPAE